MKPALFLFNGSDADGQPVCLRIVGGRIAEPIARPGDRHIDLGGGRLLPGLINAHDHLQLNALPRLKYRERYENAVQWIADIDPRLALDPLLSAHRAIPRPERLLIGGIKNLLSGVSTVAHHDPCYAALVDPAFPVRVPAAYGWSHSLVLDGEVQVPRAQRATPSRQPWIIHAAEGIDDAAAAEFDRLDALGCLAPNTVLVHGVGLRADQQRRLAQAGAGLVWCPGSNLHLFDRTLDAAALARLPRLALGSDSRISGERDLLAELALAGRLSGWDEDRLEALVTRDAAALLGLHDRGVLVPGRLADILLLPAGQALSGSSRADIRLLLIGGRPRYADPDLAEVFESLDPAAALAPVHVDGRAKRLARQLVAALRQSTLQEPGLLLQPEAAPSFNPPSLLEAQS